jgi:hypothetical protein
MHEVNSERTVLREITCEAVDRIRLGHSTDFSGYYSRCDIVQSVPCTATITDLLYVPI